MSDKDGFVHLHVHSEYSMLDGAARVGQLMEAVEAQGMPAIAVTDHGNTFGAFDFCRRYHAHGVIIMAQLLVRNLPDEVKESLRARAGDRGISIEAEARRILVDAVMSDQPNPVIEWLDTADRLREEGIAADELPLPERLPSREVRPL